MHYKWAEEACFPGETAPAVEISELKYLSLAKMLYKILQGIN
jgi:hypothetical protein